MKRIRGESGETVELPAAPAEETKRRVWPVALLLSAGLAGAVGIPLGLSSASKPLPIFEPPPSVSDPLSASPEPSPSAEEIPRPKPRPAATKTIYRTSAPKPGPTTTVYRTVVPSPGPTVYRLRPGPTITVRLPRPTVTVTRREVDTVTEIETRCYRIRNTIQVEIECPGE